MLKTVREVERLGRDKTSASRPSELLTSAHSEIKRGLYDDSDICSFTVAFLIKHNYK